MLHAALSVETILDNIVEKIVIVLEGTIYGVAHKVRQLYQSRGTRIDKQRHFCIISRSAKGMPGVLEISCESLNSLLDGGLIEHYDSSLSSARLSIEPSEELIKPAAQLFKGHLCNILARKLLLFQHYRKKPNAAWMILNDRRLESIMDCLRT